MIVYATPSYSDDLSFSVSYFENERNPDSLITFNISYKGDKSFCYYCDDYATEDDIKIVKELPKNGYNIVLMMKYSLSSIFSMNYLFTTDKRSQEEKEKYKNIVNANKNNNSNNKNSSKDKNKETKGDTNEKEMKDNKIEEKKMAEKDNKEEKSKEAKDKENKKETNKNNTDTNNKISETNKKTTTNTNKNNSSNKTTTNKINVFEEEGEPIAPNAELIQYVKEVSGGYIIGLENKSKKKRRVKLNIEGLTLTDAAYKGRGSPTFYIDPKDKKVFNAVIKSGFSGDLSFQFEAL